MVRASLVIIVCITASLLAAAGPPPDENDSVGNVDWIGQYEASQEGPLATRGREVLDAYRKLLDTVDLDGADDEVSRIIWSNALKRAEEQVLLQPRQTAIHIQLHDGTTVSGHMMERTEQFIIVRDTDGKMRAIAMDDVADIGKPADPADAGHHFAELSLKGIVGREIIRAAIVEALAVVEEEGLDAVILRMETPGGLVAELFEITSAIHEWRRRTGIPVVAFVEEALSAGAILSAACDQIFMTPTAMIGVAEQGSNTGGKWLREESEKHNALYRGRARAVAESAGHNPLLIEAMIDQSLALSQAVGEDSERLILRGIPEHVRQGDGNLTHVALLVGETQLLALTANEAVEVGLATAVVDDVEEVLAKLGFAGASPNESASIPLHRHYDEVKRIMEDIDRWAGVYKDAIADANKIAERIRTIRQRRELASTARQVIRQLDRASLGLNRIKRLHEEHAWTAIYLSPDDLDASLDILEAAIEQWKRHR